MFKDDYYTAIRPYISEDAKKVLEVQVPEIGRKVAAEIKEFGTAFADNVAKEAAKELEDALKDIADYRKTVTTITDALANDSSLLPIWPRKPPS